MDYNRCMGTLYLVATPIGNIEDISTRALRILRQVDLIAAEDTRVTRKLLNFFKIQTPITSYFEHNKISKLDSILAKLDSGDAALVSDAGTPALNDPGYELVRAALDAGHRVSPIPGPASPIAALTTSGLPTDAFLYLGYLPRKSSERRKALEKVTALPYTLIFLETPHRLIDSLKDLESILGDRQMAAARELTKLHEEIWRGRISEAREYFKAPRGEFVLVVEGRQTTDDERWLEEKLSDTIRGDRKIGKSARDIASELAQISGWTKREIYELVTKTNEERRDGGRKET